MARLPNLEPERIAAGHSDIHCAVVRVLATMQIDNEPQYREVLKQYPLPGVH